MEGFKKSPKVQCFKEGGSVQKEVNFKKRDRKNVEPNDLAQDKAIVKKAFSQHDKAKHGGSEATEIKLKKGGRAKKECGTVKKYKTGGAVENAYGAKKTDKDIKDIANSKRQKPALLCGGKSVRKMADGGILETAGDAISQGATTLKNNIMGTPAQNAAAQGRLDEIARKKAAQKAALLSGVSMPGALQQGALAGGMDQGQRPGSGLAGGLGSVVPGQKRGGKVKKK